MGRSWRLLTVVLLGAPLWVGAEVIDDTVVVNVDDPARSFSVSANDSTGGACGTGPIPSCPCAFSPPSPTLHQVVSGSSTGVFTYQPKPGVSGVDAFGYAGFDDLGRGFCDTASNLAVVTVVINAPPQVSTPFADVVVPEDAPDTHVDLAAHITDVDTAVAAPYTDSLSWDAAVIATDNPALFTSVTLTGSDLTFVHAPNQFGSATVQVTATDSRAGLAADANFVSGNSVSASFDVIVTPQNDPPMAVDDTASTDEDMALVIDVLANDFDPDGDALHISGTPSAVNGTVVVNPDDTLTFVPDPEFHGAATIDYTIGDGQSPELTASAQVLVDVAAVNDPPSGVALQTFDVEGDGFLEVTPPGLLADASDADGDLLSVVLQDPPAHGALTLNPNGSFAYTPNVGFVGSDGFTYFVSDGQATNGAAPYAVALNVTEPPAPPGPPPDGDVQSSFPLANLPLERLEGVDPAVMVLMDDSGSMDWTLAAPEEREGRFLAEGRDARTVFSYLYALPTNVYSADSRLGRVLPSEDALSADRSFADNRFGVWRARNHEFNRLYYDPGVRYRPWRGVGPGNEEFSDVDPHAAPLDPMDPTETIDLTQPVSYDSHDVPTTRGGTKTLAVRDYYIPRYYRTPADGPGLRWDDPHQLVLIGCPADIAGMSGAHADFDHHDRRGERRYRGGPDRKDCAADDGNPENCTCEQELQNFANWFSYHRSRAYVAKDVLGRLAADATNMRIGFAAMNDQGARMPVKEMNTSPASGDKRALMDMLYGGRTGGGTPLRSRLEQIGNYFECQAGNIFDTPPSQAGDPACPVAAAPMGQCQQNYALVLSDGRWNGPDPAAQDNYDGPGSGDSPFDGGRYADERSATLADVAMHFYERDLHPELADTVRPTARDRQGAPKGAFGPNGDAMHQHMATFAIQFGLEGELQDGDIPEDVGRPVAWGDPFSDSPAKIDDLRHASLNGRGAFLTAFDTPGLLAAMESAFDEFASGQGAAGAPAFDSHQLRPGSMVFRSSYDTGTGTGDLVAERLDRQGRPEAPIWSAAQRLDHRASADRVIVTFDGDARQRAGIPFRYEALSDAQQRMLSAAQVAYLRGDRSGEGAPDLDFRVRPARLGLLGDIVNSAPIYVGAPPYRGRDRGAFPMDGEHRYSRYKSGHSGRLPMVVVGANDGMLHVFDARTGEELLGYVPDKLINGQPYGEDLSQLTSPDYNHKFFVDMTPAVGDAFIRSRVDFTPAWRTLAVGGLGAGGKGLFALDLSDPRRFATEAGASEQVLWEFTDADDVSPDPDKTDPEGLPVKDLGYTFGPPTLVMTNAETGASPARKRWAAVFGNGYNSTAGIAKLFALFIEDGVDGWDYAAGDFVKLDTGVGSPGKGLRNAGRPNALGTPRLVDVDGNGTADLAYAGDLRGNLYRFDLRDTDPSKWAVTRLFTATFPDGGEEVPQPITAQPIVVANRGQEGYVVIVGSGSFVTLGDATSRDIQTLYGIWDRLEASPDIGRDDLVEQDIGDLVDPRFGHVRTLTRHEVKYGAPSTTRGWFIDFDALRAATDLAGAANSDITGNAPPAPQFPGERPVRELQLRGGFLFVNTVIPRDRTTCVAGPGGFTMALNPLTGARGGLRAEIAFDLDGDGVFDEGDNAGDGSVISGTRYESAVPLDSTFIGNWRYTELSDRELSVVGTNTNRGRRTGRLAWRQLDAPHQGWLHAWEATLEALEPPRERSRDQHDRSDESGGHHRD